MVEIRPCRLEECADVLALWQRADAIPSPTDSLEELTRLVRAHTDYLLLALELQEEVLVTDVRGDGHHLGVTQANQLGVDHRVADPDVRQEPAIAVPWLNIELEANPTADDETSIHLGRRAAARLRAFDRVIDLRRIDADVADLLDAIDKPNVDGVAVDDADHRALDGVGACSADREERQE